MSKDFEQWMQAYSRDHQNPTNKLIHKVCVPLILFSVLALLWLVKIPIAGTLSTNLSLLISFFGLVFYLKLNRFYFMLMFIKVALMLALISYISKYSWFLSVSLGVFIAAWIAQFIGHKIEGQKPSFLEDLAFLMIGPLWVLRSFIEKK